MGQNKSIQDNKYSGMYLSVGRLRGILTQIYFKIKNNEMIVEDDIEDIGKILDTTSTNHIAESLTIEEDDLIIDYNEYLTKSEINKLHGYE
jgi:hypothetical protein